MVVKQRIAELLQKYQDGTATVSETKEMFQLLAEHEALFREQMGTVINAVEDNDYNRENWQHLFKNIESHIAPASQVKKIQFTRWVAAAAVIPLISLALYFTVQQNVSGPSTEQVTQVLPGVDKATLTLADGRKIQLPGKQIIKDGELVISNTDNELVYTNNANVSRNTMQTPQGGQYRLQLADGTRVWLNAASSITYPTAFTGKSRVVDLHGEAYFEVVTDKLRPFIVNVAGKKVEVLGTAFNINSYTNEPAMQTTLLNGAIRINDSILTPGKAWINGNIKKADTSRVLAWKNGLFNFDGATLEELMRQLERWYNIRVVYQNTLPNNIIFKGEMYRNVKFADVLDFLQRMGVNCHMDGKTLIVH